MPTRRELLSLPADLPCYNPKKYSVTTTATAPAMMQKSFITHYTKLLHIDESKASLAKVRVLKSETVCSLSQCLMRLLLSAPTKDAWTV